MVKKRFVILREANEYPFGTQAQIVSACGVIHNFIRIYAPEDIPQPYTAVEVTPAQRGTLGIASISSQESRRATQKREDIAQAMWHSYELELQSRA